jgi:3-oxoacyl-(acyl-carrier-protein) synthase
LIVWEVNTLFSQPFSYLYSREPTNSSKFSIDGMVKAMQLTERLAEREEVHPGELDHALETRARMHRSGAPYSPVYPTVGRLFPGTYYLNGIDSQWRRTYSRVPLDADVFPSGSSLAPPIVLRLAQREALTCPVTGKLQVLASAEAGTVDQITEARRRIACVITGTAAGLPGRDKVFDKNNLQRLIEGEQCITPLSEGDKQGMLEKNVVQLLKQKDGTIKKMPVDSELGVIKLAAKVGSLDLSESYGIPPGLAQTMDIAAQLAVAAGMEALKDAGLVSGLSNDPSEWKLSEQYRDSTGVVYASSFPAMDAAVGEVMRFLQSQKNDASSMRLVSALRSRLLSLTAEKQLSDEDEAAFARLLSRSQELEPDESATSYEFDRKFLFRVLVLGNAQLAQLAGCRGPNTQTNAACAGTTQAIAMAQDMLISGRAERVVVVAGDNASGSTLLPWLGSGFRALGAACTKGNVEDAAMPFDKRRSGMLLGAGGIGLVLETEMSSIERQKLSKLPFQAKARLLHTQYSNSAYHGAALDRKHIASELERFLTDIELVHGISKAEIATHGVYFSHETSTHASDASSCSGNEIASLRQAFGDALLSKLLILNTKGFTGHPMGVSFEDVAAVEVLMKQSVPPIPNYSVKDEYLGDLNISKGGPYACRYALRFAAGFGSQVVFALYATAQYE